ncbi:MAG: RHS repeat-associated core domain-containing protein [Ignavibacteriales bacterium]|nr:MAG: RHS repeat-associated core domain-containing protein [Ignavibacteriales bacterium]
MFSLAIPTGQVSGSADTLMFYNIYGLGLEGRAEQTWNWNYETEPPQIERSDEPYYYIKDHLGTIRVTINKQGTVVYAADYWPYGEKMAEYNSGTGTVQRYIFTEKERDTETGYDYFGARFYDSDLGRWMTVDPLADKYPGWSPYNYVMGNPLNSFDPDGKEVRLNNRKDAERLAKEINTVLGGEHVFVVEIIINDGDNNQHYFRIDANESSLDWGKDVYLSAAYDVFASREHIFSVEFSNSADAKGGGYFKAIGELMVGVDNKNDNLNHHDVVLSKSNNKYKNGTLDVIFMHEAVGHGHPVTGIEYNGNASEVSEYFGFNKSMFHKGYINKTGWKASQLNLWRRK